MDDKEINTTEEEPIVLEDTSNDVSFENVDDEGVEESQDAKIKKLRTEIVKLHKERAEYLTGWQRTKADYVNQSRVHTEERADLLKTAARKTILTILPSMDTYDLARANTSSWSAVDANWRMGIEYIFQQLLNGLETQSLKKFGAVGDTFDTTLHESVEAIQVSDRIQDNTVMTVLQSGYMLHEKVIRPARVNVGIFEIEN